MLENKGTDCEKIKVVDNFLSMIDKITLDRQTYYTKSCEMLKSAEVGLRKREKKNCTGGHGKKKN